MMRNLPRNCPRDRQGCWETEGVYGSSFPLYGCAAA